MYQVKDYYQLQVTYQGKPIGVLTYNGQEYVFEYSADFNTTKLQPLPGITPPKSSSKILWAYFQSRIPGQHTGVFKRLAERYQLSQEDMANQMVLLATVGRVVATDPFIIEKPAQ